MSLKLPKEFYVFIKYALWFFIAIKLEVGKTEVMNLHNSNKDLLQAVELPLTIRPQVQEKCQEQAL